MDIQFNKYQGTGNDFVIIDNRTGICNDITTQQVKHLCDRHFGVGADGLMLLNHNDNHDFEMKYYNADGHEGSMCGNGGRCLVKFALQCGIRKEHYHFIASDGEHEASIDDEGWVTLKMKPVSGITSSGKHFILNTGSPHYVEISNDIMKIDVYHKGRDIRYSKEFEKEGINVNFMQYIDDDTIYVRTYERGVEDETLSCGTGVTASALVAAHNERGFNSINIKTPGGILRVEFDKTGEDQFEEIWLCGPADFVFSGQAQLPD
jgi:diaminopimelate epimerase